MPTPDEVQQSELKYALQLGSKYPALTPLFDPSISATTGAEVLDCLVQRATGDDHKEALLGLFLDHALNARADKLADGMSGDRATLVRVRRLRAARKFPEALKVLDAAKKGRAGSSEPAMLVAERAAVFQALSHSDAWERTLAALELNPVEEVALATLIRFVDRDGIVAAARAARELAQARGVSDAPVQAAIARYEYTTQPPGAPTDNGAKQRAKDTVAADDKCLQAHLTLVDLLRDEAEIAQAIDAAMAAVPMHADIKRRYLHFARTTGELNDAARTLADLRRLDPERDEWLDVEISILTRAGKVREALRKAEDAASRKSTHQPLLQRIAYTYALTGHFCRAHTLLSDVPNRSEGTWAMWLMVLIMEGQYDEAMTVADKAIGEMPRGARVLALKAWLHANRGETAQADDLYDKAIRREPTNYLAETSRCEVLLMQRKFDEARAGAEKVVTQFPAALDARLVLAEVAMAKQLYDDALTCIEQVLTRDRSRTDALQMKVIALYRSQKEKLAFECLENAIQAFPDSIGLIACRGYLRLLEWDISRAEHDFETARKRKRAGVMSTTGLGIIYSHRRLHHWAITMFDHVCKLHRASPEAQVNLAWAYHATANIAERDRARRLILTALEADASSARAKSCLAEILWAEGQRQRAMLEMTDAANGQTGKLDVDVQVAYGSMLARAGRFKEALVQLEPIVSAFPRHYAARVELASALMKSDDYAAAKAAARSAADEYPEVAAAHCLLAVCNERGGDRTKAEESLRHALSCCADFERNEVRLELARLLLRSGGDAVRADGRVREAAQLLRRVVDSEPRSQDAILLQARAELKLGNARRALAVLDRVRADDRNETTLTALRQLAYEQLRDIPSKTQQAVIVTIVLLQLVFVWARWYTKPEFADSTTFLTLVPVLTGLLIIGLVLPRLTTFKMPAVEATLNSTTQTTRNDIPTLAPSDFRNQHPILPIVPVRAYDM